MKTGVVLPIFTDTPDAALAVAAAAEWADVDGVFCYDHLWPMGQPERPALAPFPVLAAVGSATGRVGIGTLVARIGLVPDHVLLAQFAALEVAAPGRVVAGLGTGDRLSAAENHAYGIPMPPADERRASLRRCATDLVARGVPVWIGGGAPATVAVAEEVGAACNLWAASPEAVAVQSRRCEVTWGGPLPKAPVVGDASAGSTDVGGEAGDPRRGPLERLAVQLAEAGATWMVVPWPVDLDELVAAGRVATAAVQAVGGGSSPSD